MTIQDVELLLRERDDDFVSEQTVREITTQLVKFDTLTSKRQDTFTEGELIELIKAFITKNSYFRKAKILPYDRNIPPTPYRKSFIVAVGNNILIYLCREKGAWVFRYNLNV